MHADEIDVTADMVARLIAAQFPQWSGLPIRPVSSTGTVNAMFRLGETMAVRMSRVPWGADDVIAEARWLPRLAPHLPVAVPTPIAEGRPTGEYPWTWMVLDWLDGVNPIPGRPARPDALAADLAAFVRAFRTIDLPDGPQAYRGGSLAALDAPTRAAIAQLHGVIDTDAATAVWDAALQAPPWDGPPTWVHADLLPGNVLTVDGRLSAVIDFATVGVGDPACDLMVAWNLLPSGARAAFRSAADADDATWTRARGRALSMSLIALPYYRDIDPAVAAPFQHTIDEVLADARP
ncbi:aminoglycoside phosphotransferase family protein [Nonomuraea sp. H19]|uniref:aminoglycoside phosphotransferase family protein n=1 Tax=Nonomuraea sp. H19 TaxID=3452206 RepID=UPI003F89627A